MPRLRSRATGVVVSTSDEVAAQLNGYEWEQAEKPKRASSSEK